MLYTFYDIYIKTIKKGTRPNTHFDKTGWKFMVIAFEEQADHALTKAQLKNKWDDIKRYLRIWKKLISKTKVC